jgi:hypothetical protein
MACGCEEQPNVIAFDSRIRNEELAMQKLNVSLAELILIAGTRGILGAGLGLLMGEKLTRGRRRTIGWTLLGVGAAATVPLAAIVIKGALARKRDEDQSRAAAVERKISTAKAEAAKEPERETMSAEL